MKKNIYIAVLVLIVMSVVLPLLADTGQVNYQARLLDSYGRRVNGTVDLTFKIYDAATDGNLLWSETHTGVVVQDGVYSVVLGSQTAIPASVFSQNNTYLELGIDNETLSPRQQMTAAAYALVARTIMGSNIFENQTSGYVGIGTTNPVVKLDVSGPVKMTGFKMPTGAFSGYILVSDSDGIGTWRPISYVMVESDPIHTNWVRVVYTPATNDIWNAIGTEATTRAAADTALQNNIDTSSNALSTAIGTEATTRANADTALQNNINTSSNALNASKLNLSGGVMTGPLTNEVGFYGNGLGLTNVPASGLILTNYLQRTGDSMTGPLVISNNLTVSGRSVWQPGMQAFSDNNGTVQVAQAYVRIGTTDNAVKNLNGSQIAAGAAGQALLIQCTNTAVVITNGHGVVLEGGVSFTMSANDTIQLVYDGAKWVEVRRSDN
jgi:hypothetical protein